MNFTREPIIETVITPREGNKIVVRSSKGNGQEDYFVDAVEVVSFGHALFFRSVEKPKPFLVPVSDYEIIELRETRMVLKNVPTERALKVTGGRDNPPRQSREIPQEQPREEAPEAQPTEEASTSSDPRQQDRKRDRRRRGRRGRTDRDTPESADVASMQEGDKLADSENAPIEVEETQNNAPNENPKPSASFMSLLLPPPPQSIFQQLRKPKIVEDLKEVAEDPKQLDEELQPEHLLDPEKGSEELSEE